MGHGYGFNVEKTENGTTIDHGGGFPGISASFKVALHTEYVAIVLSNFDAGMPVLSGWPVVSSTLLTRYGNEQRGLPVYVKPTMRSPLGGLGF